MEIYGDLIGSGLSSKMLENTKNFPQGIRYEAGRQGSRKPKVAVESGAQEAEGE